MPSKSSGSIWVGWNQSRESLKEIREHSRSTERASESDGDIGDLSQKATALLSIGKITQNCHVCLPVPCSEMPPESLLWHPNKSGHLWLAQHSLEGRTQSSGSSPPGGEAPLVLRRMWFLTAVQWELSWSRRAWLASTDPSVCFSHDGRGFQSHSFGNHRVVISKQDKGGWNGPWIGEK